MIAVTVTDWKTRFCFCSHSFKRSFSRSEQSYLPEPKLYSFSLSFVAEAQRSILMEFSGKVSVRCLFFSIWRWFLGSSFSKVCPLEAGDGFWREKSEPREIFWTFAKRSFLTESPFMRMLEGWLWFEWDHNSIGSYLESLSTFAIYQSILKQFCAALNLAS